MSAYIVFMRTKTIDQTELDRYRAGIEATMKGHPIEVLAADGKHEVLEGDPIEGMVVVKFPGVKAERIGLTARPTKTSPSTANLGRPITDSLLKVSANVEEIHT